MTRRFFIVFFMTLMCVGGLFLTMETQKVKNFYQKELDKQAEMIYNKDREINELTYQRNVLQNAVDELERKIEEHRQEEVSRGSGRKFMCQTSAYSIDVELTYYGPSGTATASGTIPQVGRTVACNFLPFGTRVLIDGHEYIVEDVGGALGDSVIDVFVESDDVAYQLGRRNATVQVLY